MARNKPKTHDTEIDDTEIEQHSKNFGSALAAANAKVDTALDEWINCGEILENAKRSVRHGQWLRYRTTHFLEVYNIRPTEAQAYVCIYIAATGGLKKNSKPYLTDAKNWWLKNKNTRPIPSGWSGLYEVIRAYLARDKTKREAKPRAKPVPRARHDKIVAALLERERILARIVLEDRKALPADLPPVPADDDGGDEPPPPAAMAPGGPVADDGGDDGANCEPAYNLPPSVIDLLRSPITASILDAGFTSTTKPAAKRTRARKAPRADDDG